MIRVDIDIKKGGLTLSQDFYVDLSKEDCGPSSAHESRYPGGDCTNDIYL
jgi:selenium-binding protein 1